MQLIFSGKAQAWVEVKSPIKVISMMPNSLPIEAGPGGAAIEEFTGETFAHYNEHAAEIRAFTGA